jgi:hypothetical protein
MHPGLLQPTLDCHIQVLLPQIQLKFTECPQHLCSARAAVHQTVVPCMSYDPKCCLIGGLPGKGLGMLHH